MYRDAGAEFREHALERRRECIERAHALLTKHRYGRHARATVTELVAQPDPEDVSELESSLDALEQALAAFVEEAKSDEERASRFHVLGGPSQNFEVYGPKFSSATGVLLESAARWAQQLTDVALVDAVGDALTLYFEQDRVPLRLDIATKRFDDGEVYDAATLSAAPPSVGTAEIAIRPQTMGDDILASLHIRRDLTFDDDLFDTTYFVSGDEADLRALLTPATRAALLRVARDWPATVHIAGGIATMPLHREERLLSAASMLARFGS